METKISAEFNNEVVEKKCLSPLFVFAILSERSCQVNTQK